ncbi:MAG: diguanylate cyclase, partial [Roseiflexus sp.]|nr:diguanylate cyclase [Roseiflexus sp.]
ERLRAAIEGSPISLHAHPVRVTISIGCAALDSISGNDRLEMLIHRADRALYSAKAGGRNQVASDP